MTDHSKVTREELKPRLAEYLQKMGKEVPSPGKGGVCPVCNGGHKTGCFSIKGDFAKCFSCDAKGDIFDWIGHIEGITDKNEQFKRATEIFNYPWGSDAPKKKEPPEVKSKPEVHDYRGYYQKCQAAAQPGISYLKGRGISEETSKAQGIGYDPEKKILIIPVSDSYYVSRTIEGKQYYNSPGSSAITNEHLLDQKDPVFIVEGAIDALSIQETGGKAIALNSTSNYTKLLEAIKHRENTPTLILSLDNDEAGERAATSLKNALQKEKRSYIIMGTSGTFKDQNERLQSDRAGLEADIDAAIERAYITEAEDREKAEREQAAELEEYQNSNVSAYLENYLDVIARKSSQPAISTGFPLLDKTLDGGLFPGLYIMGALSSLGKTTFILQIADHAAAAGHDVLFFSLEMSRIELIAKSISRNTFLLAETKRNAKTTRGILNGSVYKNYTTDETQLIVKALTEHKKAGKNLYITEALGDIGTAEIRERIDTHRRLTGRTPLIVIDYLQILKPFDPKSSDKQNTDKAVIDLKRISRDYSTPVLAVSSLNRENYSVSISMQSFKESGAIEYSSDVLIGLQISGASDWKETQGAKGNNKKEIEEAKKKKPRELELVILKNRNGEYPEHNILYDYYPAFNYFTEGMIQSGGTR